MAFKHELQDETPETIEIGNLEYDVAAAGSLESSASEENQAASHIVFYKLPDRI